MKFTKTRSTPVSLPLKGQITRNTTVKWTINKLFQKSKDIKLFLEREALKVEYLWKSSCLFTSDFIASPRALFCHFISSIDCKTVVFFVLVCHTNARGLRTKGLKRVRHTFPRHALMISQKQHDRRTRERETVL